MTEFIVTTVLLVLVLIAAAAALAVLLVRGRGKKDPSADTPLSEEYFAETLHEVEKEIKASVETQ